ncbi:hypothetical protein ACP4OV_002212 [Aristida adscensionis]
MFVCPVDANTPEGAEMATPVSASLGVMGPLLEKLDMLFSASDDPRRKLCLPDEVKDGVHHLKMDLEEISLYLQDLSEVEDPPLTAKCWMKEARELSYDVEDYIDRYVQPCSSFSVKTIPISRIIIPVKITCLKRKRKIRKPKGIADMVWEFRIRAQEAIERHDRYDLHCGAFRRRYAPVGPMLPTPCEPGADLVLDGRMCEFIDSMAKDGDEQLKVLSVIGSGGIGKTTFVRVMYEKLRGQFDCGAFVRVSRNPDIKAILLDILTQIQGHKAHDCGDDLDLIIKIKKHLQDKRYLIIIDDLWAASVWDIISPAFPEDSQLSRIIIVTEIEDVALSCCCYHSEYVFEVKPLHHVHSRKLFFSKFHCTESNFPHDFKGVSNRIVEICGGLPLATISIAGLLASHPVILMEQWTYISDSLGSSLRESSTSEGTRLVLNFSYNNLAHYLKTCLLYLDMYPEGSTIFKDDLVKQWVAEGFIDAAEGRDIRKIAENYFDELIQRGFLQPSCIKYNYEVVSCTVHGMVHDLIAYKSVEDNFIRVVECDQENVELSDKVHRLSLNFGEAKYAKMPENIRTSQVRSLTFVGLFMCMPSIAQFKLLRVLNIQLCGYRVEGKLDFTGISELFHLRYLKVASDMCIELPKHMRGLQYLETLDINTKVSGVPWDIIHLPCLLHLHLPFDTNLFDLILSMRSASLQSLGKLINLQDLRLTCFTPPPKHVLEALGSLLSGHGRLKTLGFIPGPSNRNDGLHGSSEVIVSWDNFTPALLLQKLEWFPSVRTFLRVPKWIKELDNLCILKIAIWELVPDGVDILRGLPFLTALSLYVQATPLDRIIFDKAGFSVLKYFKLRCSAIPRLKFETDAVPKLQKLKLGFKATNRVDQQNCAHIRIEHLPGLKEISVKIWGTIADEECARTAEISNHPSNPRINVQLVDRMSCSREGTSSATEVKEHESQEEDSVVEENPDDCYLTIDEEWEDNDEQARTVATYDQAHIMQKEQSEFQDDESYVTADEDSWEENKHADLRISMTPESYIDPPTPELKKDERKPVVMEAATVCAFSGVMNSVVKKLSNLLAEEQSVELKGAQNEAMLLKRELDATKTSLEQMVNATEQSREMKDCSNQIRELTYDIEDYIDGIMLQFDRGVQATAGRSQNWAMIKMFGDKIRTYREKLEKADLGRMGRKTQITDTGSSCFVACESWLSMVYDKGMGLVGMDGLRDQLVKQVFGGGQERQVACVQGPAGVGKTKLVVNVYNHNTNQFWKRAFVSLSKKANITMVLRDILSQIKPGPSSHRGMEGLIQDIREILRCERYLVVLDGVWSAQIWDDIKHALPENFYESRIIITTSIKDVTESFGNRSSSVVYRMGPLSSTDSVSLFQSIIFGLPGSWPIGLERVGEKIVQACGGIPLAISLIAGLLGSKPAEREQWEMVDKCMELANVDSLNVEGMRKICSICYSDLPLDLRSCLLYLTAFPENHLIRKDILIRRWVSEGFLPQRKDKSRWETGESYFLELVARKLIEPIHFQASVYGIKIDAVPFGCRVHGLVYDFIRYLSSEENFVKWDISDPTCKQHDAFERLPVRLSCDTQEVNGKSEIQPPLALFENQRSRDLSRVRSLALFGSVKGISRIWSFWTLFKCLRVLDLEGSRGLTDYHLQSIGCMPLLRFLGLRATGVRHLPEEIMALQHLATLDVRRTGVRQLPTFTRARVRHVPTFTSYKLVSLLADGLEIPIGMCDVIQGLEELSTVHLGKDEVLDAVSELVNQSKWLRMLGVEFSGAWMIKIPPEIASLVDLTHLHMEVDFIEAEGLGALGKLPNLVLLSLTSREHGAERCLISAYGFQCLKVFCVKHSYVKGGAMGLQFGSGAMPQLRMLRLELFKPSQTLSRYGDFDFGIQHLSLLAQVRITINCKDAQESDMEAAEAAIKDQVSRIPNKPLLELNRFQEHRTGKSDGIKKHVPFVSVDLLQRGPTTESGLDLRPDKGRPTKPCLLGPHHAAL